MAITESRVSETGGSAEHFPHLRHLRLPKGLHWTIEQEYPSASDLLRPMVPSIEGGVLDLADVAKRISDEGSSPTPRLDGDRAEWHGRHDPVPVPDALVEQLTLGL